VRLYGGAEEVEAIPSPRGYQAALIFRTKTVLMINITVTAVAKWLTNCNAVTVKIRLTRTAEGIIAASR
jgi:hypothetical protein